MHKRATTETNISSPVLSIPDAARYVGIGRSSIYAFIADGRLPRIKLGKRVLIRVADLDALLDQAGTAA